jgi:Domain of unknown function (DUF4150)
MSLTILVNKLTLCHGGDTFGSSTATLPDVCLTPPNAVPTPYPNVALAVDLAGGTATVFVDGGNMAANKPSVFARSAGDEPGTLGGVVSGVNMGEASWISYSMDVFLEGENACRLTDKMLMNHGNTVCMAGFKTWLNDWKDAANKGKVDCQALADIIEKLLNGTKDAGTTPFPGVRGVKERYNQQVYGRQGPGTDGWRTHENEYKSMRDWLKKLVDEFKKWCEGGGGPPLPYGAEEWSTKAPPDALDYKGPPPSKFSPWVIGGIIVVAGIIAVAVFPPLALPIAVFAK